MNTDIKRQSLRYKLILAFLCGVVFIGSFVVSWPVMPGRYERQIVELSHETPADRRRCDLIGGYGHRLFGPADAEGRQTTCLLLLYGNFNASGDFIVAREIRNPFDVDLLRYSVSTIIYKKHIRTVSAAVIAHN